MRYLILIVALVLAACTPVRVVTPTPPRADPARAQRILNATDNAWNVIEKSDPTPATIAARFGVDLKPTFLTLAYKLDGGGPDGEHGRRNDVLEAKTPAQLEAARAQILADFDFWAIKPMTEANRPELASYITAVKDRLQPIR